MTQSNYDPRDEREARPQVGFRVRAGAIDYRAFFDAVRQRAAAYHDMMVFEAVGDEVPGTIRFSWETEPAVVDSLAEWLAAQPHVLRVFPAYGGPVDSAGQITDE